MLCFRANRRSVECSAAALPVVKHHPDRGHQSAARHLHSVPSPHHLAVGRGQGEIPELEAALQPFQVFKDLNLTLKPPGWW